MELSAGAGLASGTRAPAYPVIDTHIHLFDTTRAQGVPWPAKDDKILYRPALPERYRKIAEPFGIQGAIEIECSSWLEDNQWVLDVAAQDKIIVGMIGNLEPDAPAFASQLERFHKNPLFLGIRYGNLWDRDLGVSLHKAAFVDGLKLLAESGLVLDVANPTPRLMRDVVRATDLAPELRVVLDHLPQMEPSPELAELARRPRVYVKISGVLRRLDGRVPLDLPFYAARLDYICGMFGEDRLLFGSDWPNSDRWGDYAQVFRLVHEYFTAKGAAAAEKYFWKNSVAAYRWVKRQG